MTTYQKLLLKKKKEIDKAIKKISKKPSAKGKMSFYEYRQNNSGGSFVSNKNLCHKVVIEAPNEEAANSKAFNLGIYFDGCSIGRDCGCCGDRWYAPDSITFPHRHGTFNLEDAQKTGVRYEPTTWIRCGNKKPEPDQYDLIFDTIEELAAYECDPNYSWTEPEVRVYFANGKVKEFFANKVKK